MAERRRFPPRGRLRTTGACFIVRDKNGQALAYVISRTSPAGAAANLLTRDEARRIAANIAKLPDSFHNGGEVQ